MLLPTGGPSGSWRPVCLLSSGAGLASSFAPSYPSKGATCSADTWQAFRVPKRHWDLTRRATGGWPGVCQSPASPAPPVAGPGSPGRGARPRQRACFPILCRYGVQHGMPRGGQAALLPAWCSVAVLPVHARDAGYGSNRQAGRLRIHAKTSHAANEGASSANCSLSATTSSYAKVALPGSRGGEQEGRHSRRGPWPACPLSPMGKPDPFGLQVLASRAHRQARWLN